MEVRKLKSDELQHHGVKGQRWGVRRYQNPDGTLTLAGRKRLLNPDGTLNKKGDKYVAKVKKEQISKIGSAMFDGDLSKVTDAINETNIALQHLTGQKVSSVKMWENDPRVVKTVEFVADTPIVRITDGITNGKKEYRNRFSVEAPRLSPDDINYKTKEKPHASQKNEFRKSRYYGISNR